MYLPMAIMDPLLASRGQGFLFVAFVIGLAVVACGARGGARGRCRRCHQINPQHARYCAHCGAQLDR